MFDLFVAGQQLGKIERGTNLADALAGVARTSDVIKQVVQEIGDGMIVESLCAFVDHQFYLPVRLPEQALQGNRRFQPAILQRFEDAAHDPPELVHVVAIGRVLQRLYHIRQRIQVPFVIAALNLIMDFDFIEKGSQMGAPKYMEWYGAFGLMVTLIWLYIEFLRLLARFSGRD